MHINLPRLTVSGTASAMVHPQSPLFFVGLKARRKRQCDGVCPGRADNASHPIRQYGPTPQSPPSTVAESSSGADLSPSLTETWSIQLPDPVEDSFKLSNTTIAHLEAMIVPWTRIRSFLECPAGSGHLFKLRDI